MLELEWSVAAANICYVACDRVEVYVVYVEFVTSVCNVTEY